MDEALEFEKLVERIIRVLQSDGAEVKHNVQFPDPNVPGETRQIDVEVRRGNDVTFVECRRHSRPQDVQWIEHLIGKKATLKPVAMIGVSSSGFTDRALKYAKGYGIILRHLSDITPEELKTWGRKPTWKFTAIRFRDLVIHLRRSDCPQGVKPEIDIDWRNILLHIATLKGYERINSGQSLRFEMSVKPISLAGRDIAGVLTGKLQRVDHFRELASIRVFRHAATLEKLASVDLSTAEGNEIIRGPQGGSAIIDFSSVSLQRNSLFKEVLIDAGEKVLLSEYQLLGLDKAMSAPIAYDVKFHDALPAFL